MDGYIKYVDKISKEEFLELFPVKEKLSECFSAEELRVFHFPESAGSLAARYLVKKRIRDQLGRNSNMADTEILNDDFGKPEIIFGVKILSELTNSGIKDVLCSISHSRNYVVGMTLFLY